jgi:hypothetical protein
MRDTTRYHGKFAFSYGEVGSFPHLYNDLSFVHIERIVSIGMRVPVVLAVEESKVHNVIVETGELDGRPRSGEFPDTFFDIARTRVHEAYRIAQ